MATFSGVLWICSRCYSWWECVIPFGLFSRAWEYDHFLTPIIAISAKKKEVKDSSFTASLFPGLDYLPNNIPSSIGFPRQNLPCLHAVVTPTLSLSKVAWLLFHYKFQYAAPPKNINPAKGQIVCAQILPLRFTSDLAVNPVSSLKSDHPDLKAMISGSYEKIPIMLL